ncbi:MAG TPA: hypothetical protein VN621_06640 [Arthrobacter sp.]|nr:hypothetical protein [Arthrobacter sp.]
MSDQYPTTSYNGQPAQGGPMPPAGQPGYPYPGQPGWNQQPPVASGMTKASMIVGIIAVVLSFIPVVGFISFILGPIALVLGIIALVKKLPRKGFALTGVITGAVALVVCVVYVLVAIAVAGALQDTAEETASYTYEVTGEGDFTVNYLTDSIDDMKSQDVTGGKFSQDVEASKLFGLVGATNAKGNTGTLTCTVTDANGTVVTTNTSSGSAAQVSCPVAVGLGK